jgi:hypothetical protein
MFYQGYWRNYPESQTFDVKLKRWLLLTPTIAEAAAIKLAKSKSFQVIFESDAKLCIEALNDTSEDLM